MAGRRRDLSSLMVDWGEIEMGMEVPLNLTLIVMVASELASLAPPMPLPLPLSISPSPMMRYEA